MANAEHLEVLQQGVPAWNRWYKECYWNTTPDLTGADLSQMDGSGANLNFARLEGASLRGCHAQRASFVKSNLSHVDLSHADLRGANFREARLNHASFSFANLEEVRLDRARLVDAHLHGAHLKAAQMRRANLVSTNLGEASFLRADLQESYFHSTDLRSADLSGARLGKNVWIHIDFSPVHGLETVVHTASAFRVDGRTFFRSQKHCPEAFWRQVGFAEEQKVVLQSRDRRCLAFPTCLLSYASEDRAFAEQLLRDLEARGVLCQAQPYEATTGKLIAVYDKLLLVLSTASPSWGMNDLYCLLKEARVKASWEAPSWQESSIVCPIRLGDTFQAKIASWPSSYRCVMLPSHDFSGWRDQDTYQHALNQFFQDLSDETSRKASAEPDQENDAGSDHDSYEPVD